MQLLQFNSNLFKGLSPKEEWEKNWDTQSHFLVS